MRKGIIGLLLLLAAFGSARASDLRLPIQGEVGINEQGEVFDYRTSSELSPLVLELVDKHVRSWKFQPVVRNGVAIPAKAAMRMTLTLRPVDAGYEARIEEVHFSGIRKSITMEPPRYPPQAARVGVGGDVLIAVRVDAAGQVVEAAAIQHAWPYRSMSLSAVDNWAPVFAKASIAAAMRWKFEPAGPGDEPDTTLVVPIDYRMEGMPTAGKGWRREVAGPLSPIPWLNPERQSFDVDDLRHGQALVVGESVKLLTPVVGATL